MGDGSVLRSSVKREALLSVPGGGFEPGQAIVHRTCTPCSQQNIHARRTCYSHET